ncbi:MAG: hypothetical protein COA49_05995 [Bacteroidetes bacterium]|nr:MAG: hypothetical protein COA49_05995 [Bacteroidota bacterium]
MKQHQVERKFSALRSAIAHLYFESIHPFEDGNGRIGRSIAEKALLQTVGHPLLLSLSVSIEKIKPNITNHLELEWAVRVMRLQNVYVFITVGQIAYA